MHKHSNIYSRFKNSYFRGSLQVSLFKRLLLFVTALSILLTPLLTNDVFAQQSSNCASNPGITSTNSVPVQRDYDIWVLMKKASNDATAQLQVDNGGCLNLGSPSGSDWQWVSGSGSTLRRNLSAGSHTFNVSVNAGSMFIDRVLVTSKPNCVPEGRGQNCLEPNLDFAVRGITPGETIVRGSRPVVSAQLIDNTLIGAEFTFSFDNNVNSASRVASPYCYVMSGSECGGVNIDSLSDGAHTLNVLARTPAGQTLTRRVNFSIQSQSQPAPNPTPNPNPTPIPPVDYGNSIDFTVKGLSDGAKITGGVIVSTDVVEHAAPNDGTYTVTYTLDGNSKIGYSWTKPYCLNTDKSGQCGLWDTTKITDGAHQLMVTVAKTPYNNKLPKVESSKTYNITITNTPIGGGSGGNSSKGNILGIGENNNQGQNNLDSKGNPVQAQPTPNVVVVGNPKAEVKAKATLTVPDSYLEYANPASKVTYKVDDKVVASLPVSKSKAIVDTAGFVNGAYTVTASISNPDGSEEIFGSDIEIQNGFATSTVNWASENRGLSSVAIISIIGCIAILAFYGVNRIRLSRSKKGKKPTPTEAKVSTPQSKSIKAKLKKVKPSYVAVGLFSFGIIGLIATLSTNAMSTSVGFMNILIQDSRNTLNVPENIKGYTMGQGTHDHFPDGSMRAYYQVTARSAPAPTPTPPTPTPTPPTTGTPGGVTVNESQIPAPASGSNQFRVSTGAGRGSPDGTQIGAFRTNCTVSHMNFDDALVFPGIIRATHLHTYVGNTSVNGNSTPNSVRTTGNVTCTGGTANRSAYWFPTIVDTSTSTPIAPGPANSSPANRVSADRDHAVQIYYKTGYDGVDPTTVRNFPEGLRMIAGTSSATTPTFGVRPIEGSQKQIVRYSCRSEIGAGARVDNQNSFPNCGVGEIFGMHIDFPQCWNGRDLDSPNHKTHMSYGGGWPNRGCPSTHPVPLAQITQNIYYRVPNAGMSNWRLTSDTYSGPAGYSGHADWMDGWDKSVFQSVVDNCYQRRYDCSMNLLGDGRALY